MFKKVWTFAPNLGPSPKVSPVIDTQTPSVQRFLATYHINLKLWKQKEGCNWLFPLVTIAKKRKKFFLCIFIKKTCDLSVFQCIFPHDLAVLKIS